MYIMFLDINFQAKISEEESKEKKLKKLTPEQRLKYFGPEKSNLSVDTKEPVTDNKEAAQNGKATTGLSNQVKTRRGIKND